MITYAYEKRWLKNKWILKTNHNPLILLPPKEKQHKLYQIDKIDQNLFMIKKKLTPPPIILNHFRLYSNAKMCSTWLTILYPK